MLDSLSLPLAILFGALIIALNLPTSSGIKHSLEQIAKALERLSEK